MGWKQAIVIVVVVTVKILVILIARKLYDRLKERDSGNLYGRRCILLSLILTLITKVLRSWMPSCFWDRTRNTSGTDSQGSNYRRGCQGFPRHWSLFSPALLQPKPSQPRILFILSSARLCLITNSTTADSNSQIKDSFINWLWRVMSLYLCCWIYGWL